MAGQMWLANKNYGAWVPCPSIEMPSGTQKWNASGQFLNGGAYVRRSSTGARAYEMNWPMKHQEDLDIVESFFEGVYGPGPFYVVEPGSAEYNMFPSYMATPGIAATDGPSFLYDKRPSVAGFASNAGEYMLGAEYRVVAGDLANSYTLAIPAGYTMFTYYVGSGTSLLKARLNGGTAESMFGGKEWDGGSKGSLISFALDTAATATVVIYYMCAVVKKTGTYSMSEFISHVETFPKGKGSTGMEVDGDFERTSYSAALDRYHGSVRLVEVEPWL